MSMIAPSVKINKKSNEDIFNAVDDNDTNKPKKFVKRKAGGPSINSYLKFYILAAI